ncbi:MAG: hypothetical protein KAX31_03575 [Thermoplasmata archaeon]|nr:hypothetical protein [Thermoplasmata archaeon]
MNTRLVALGIIALVLIVVFGALFGGFIVSGYGGIASRIHSVEHGYANVDAVTIVQGETIASITPDTFGPIGATAIRLELGQPQYRADDFWYSNEIIETDDYGETKRTWAVHIAYFDLGFTIKTEGVGVLAITDVTFWIELQENQFDVFTAADDVEAYILEVVTLEPVLTTDVNLVDVEPASGGFSFDMLAIDSKPIPDWMADAGYQGSLSELKDIRFSVHVNSMSPFVLGLMRNNHQATWSCEVRALVFGYWEVYSPYDKWKPPEFFNLFAFLDDIFAGLSIIVGLAVGILLSVVILKFIPDKRIATIILIVAWAMIVLMFGFLELLA